MPSNIKKIHARQVLDSRGNPTVEVFVQATGNTSAGGKELSASAIVPSGASTGSREALELRDGGISFGGKGVIKAVTNVNSIIAPKLEGIPLLNQDEIDRTLLELDGTENKSKLGANATLAVSMACCKLAAITKNLNLFEHIAELAENNEFLLPVPQMNVINGGRHAGQENDIQEHMIAPVNFKTFNEALQAGTETYHELKKNLKKKFGVRGILVGDEGGFVPPVETCAERLELISQAIEEAGYKGEIKLALDVASSEVYSEENNLYKINENTYSSSELSDFYEDLVGTFPIYSIEDPMSEHDWDGWQAVMHKMRGKTQIVADDLTVTNPKIIKEAINKSAADALLLKINQIGTITEAINAFHVANNETWNVVVSHRSGETEDTLIADLAAGLGAGQSKFGAPARSERTAKYNQLLRIEDLLEERGTAKFAGKSVLRS